MPGNVFIQISTDHLYPHPENPRKDVGDVSELSESLKKNGVMQNLTVIPKDEDCTKPSEETTSTDYIVLIGHRRLAAAKMAGITELPCKVVFDMTHNEQITTMLEENMQRSDLTIPEQVESFQMLLDLGETAQTIAEKTGFSQTTVYHRLNIAKLDKEVVNNVFAPEKGDESNYQLSIDDFNVLEKVKSIEKRNDILKNATDPTDLRYEARRAAEEEREAEWLQKMKERLIEAGIKSAPKAYEKERYSNKWDTQTRFNNTDDLPELDFLDFDEEVFWASTFNGVEIIKRAVEKKEKKTPWEIKREKEQEQKKQLETLFKKMYKERLSLAADIYQGEVKPKSSESLLDDSWAILKEQNYGSSLTNIRKKLYPEHNNQYGFTQEEIDQMDKKVGDTTMQMAAVAIALEESAVDWSGKYDKNRGNDLKQIYKIAGFFGLKLSKEQQSAVDGTSDSYLKEDK